MDALMETPLAQVGVGLLVVGLGLLMLGAGLLLGFEVWDQIRDRWNDWLER